VAISPPTDIVLGVALAAEPDKYRAAVEKLQRMSALAGARLDASEWQATLARETGAGIPASPGQPSTPVPPQRRERGPDAFGQLEAFVLQSFVKSMLPKNATQVFGKGTAGEVWKSMLAEKLGQQLAGSGQLGLADRLRNGLAATRLGGSVPPSPALAAVLPYLQQPAAAPPAAAAPATDVTPPEGVKS
jgi:flagellar protein FlgJ